MVYTFILVSTLLSAAGFILLVADRLGFFGVNDTPTPGSIVLVAALLAHAAVGVACLGALS